MVILFPIFNGVFGNSRINSGLGNCWCNGVYQSRIKRFWNNLVFTKRNIGATIGFNYFLRNGFFGKRSNGVNSSKFHGFIYCSCSDIKCPTKNKWKSKNIIDLIRVVRSPCCHDDVFSHRCRLLIGYFRFRIS